MSPNNPYPHRTDTCIHAVRIHRKSNVKRAQMRWINFSHAQIKTKIKTIMQYYTIYINLPVQLIHLYYGNGGYPWNRRGQGHSDHTPLRSLEPPVLHMIHRPLDKTIKSLQRIHLLHDVSVLSETISIPVFRGLAVTWDT